MVHSIVRDLQNKLAAPPNRLAALDQLFDGIDKNNDGVIDKQEWREFEGSRVRESQAAGITHSDAALVAGMQRLLTSQRTPIKKWFHTEAELGDGSSAPQSHASPSPNLRQGGGPRQYPPEALPNRAETRAVSQPESKSTQLPDTHSGGNRGEDTVPVWFQRSTEDSLAASALHSNNTNNIATRPPQAVANQQPSASPALVGKEQLEPPTFHMAPDPRDAAESRAWFNRKACAVSSKLSSKTSLTNPETERDSPSPPLMEAVACSSPNLHTNTPWFRRKPLPSTTNQSYSPILSASGQIAAHEMSTRLPYPSSVDPHSPMWEPSESLLYDTTQSSKTFLSPRQDHALAWVSQLGEH